MHTHVHTHVHTCRRAQLLARCRANQLRPAGARRAPCMTRGKRGPRQHPSLHVVGTADHSLLGHLPGARTGSQPIASTLPASPSLPRCPRPGERRQNPRAGSREGSSFIGVPMRPPIPSSSLLEGHSLGCSLLWYQQGAQRAPMASHFSSDTGERSTWALTARGTPRRQIWGVVSTPAPASAAGTELRTPSSHGDLENSVGDCVVAALGPRKRELQNQKRRQGAPETQI